MIFAVGNTLFHDISIHKLATTVIIYIPTKYYKLIMQFTNLHRVILYKI